MPPVFYLCSLRVCFPKQNAFVSGFWWQHACFKTVAASHGALHVASAWFGQTFKLYLRHTPVGTKTLLKGALVWFWLFWGEFFCFCLLPPLFWFSVLPNPPPPSLLGILVARSLIHLLAIFSCFQNSFESSHACAFRKRIVSMNSHTNLSLSETSGMSRSPKLTETRKNSNVATLKFHGWMKWVARRNVAKAIFNSFVVSTLYGLLGNKGVHLPDVVYYVSFSWVPSLILLTLVVAKLPEQSLPTLKVVVWIPTVAKKLSVKSII